MKSNFKIVLTVFLYYLYFTFVSAQEIPDKSVLEKRKNETIQQIELTRKLLDQTRKSAATTIGQLNLLTRNISNREKLINELDSEIQLLGFQIEANRKEIEELESNIKHLQLEYEKIIRATYRNIEKENYLEYILGAQDINQGYQRLKHIKYINEYRSRIYAELIDKKKQLGEENEKLDKILKETNDVLKLKENEFGLLSKEQKEKKQSVDNLKRQENKLIRELREKQNIQKKLESEINKLVEEEIRKSKANNIATLTPAEKLLSGDFVMNRGLLPWPVERGVITGNFGEHNHPVIKGIKVKSNGIDINTVEGEKAKAVFNGEVTKIFAILGANYTVIIKHGEFYTVYTNLINISVKVGDKVDKNEYIGTIYTDNNKSTRIHFQIWREKTLQDPEKWLAK